jgi:hypothetical protein
MMSLGLAVQPAVLQEIGKSKQMHGRGLLARFLWCVPSTMRGSRTIDAPQVAEPIRTAYASNMREVASAARARDEVHNIFLDDDASAAFKEYQDALEPRLGEDADLEQIIEWASKLAGAILRIAVLLACARERGIPEEVTREDMVAAIEFSDYLEAHAWRAFSLMGTTNGSTEHNRIIRAIREHGWTTFTLRELARATNYNRRLRQEQVEDVLDELVADGYLKRQIISTKPFKVQWAVNPAVLAEAVA